VRKEGFFFRPPFAEKGRVPPENPLGPSLQIRNKKGKREEGREYGFPPCFPPLLVENKKKKRGKRPARRSMPRKKKTAVKTTKRNAFVPCCKIPPEKKKKKGDGGGTEKGAAGFGPCSPQRLKKSKKRMRGRKSYRFFFEKGGENGKTITQK